MLVLQSQTASHLYKQRQPLTAGRAAFAAALYRGPSGASAPTRSYSKLFQLSRNSLHYSINPSTEQQQQYHVVQKETFNAIHNP